VTSAEIGEDEHGGLVVGAGVRNSDLAADRRVRKRYPVLAQALLGSVAAVAEHGDSRRKSVAAHPLRLLPGRRDAVQQAHARLRVLRARRNQPAPAAR
jgi:hypothetical protein